MQKVTILCVGKLKEKFYIDAAAEYVKRLSRFCKLELVELPEERLPEDPSPAQIEAALLKEAAAIRAKLPSGAALIALCVEGSRGPARRWPGRWLPGPARAWDIWCFSSAGPLACTPPSKQRPGCGSPCLP